MQAVIMAGGKGTRLLSVTKDEIPKPMAEVSGKPILLWQLECLKNNGITDIIIVTGHLGEKIREYFGDGSTVGINIRYLDEPLPLGTAGSFYYLHSMLSDEPFFLVFGDVIFDIDVSRMMSFHIKKQARATLFTHPNSHPIDSDLVITDADDKVLRFDSKHNVRDYWYDNCVNAGLYILEHSVCDMVTEPIKTDLEKDILEKFTGETGNVFAYRSPEYVKDVGTAERIEKAALELSCGYVAGRNLKNKQKAIFLDRDGTINRKNDFIYKPEQFALEDCAVEAIRKINESGYLAIVITNQPVVARGLCAINDIDEIHKKMKTLLGREGVFLDDVKFCPHHPDKGYPEENPAYKISCNCRKPKTGMIDDCVREYNIDLSASWFIGDSTLDIRTGKNAGTKTALVLTGDAGKDGKYQDEPDMICADLLNAVNKILEG